MAERKRILFLCTGNSCRSQMAEAWTRTLKGDIYEPFSAGVDPKGLDPRAVKAMAEVGIDMRGQRSKSVEDLPVQDFAYVVTLCSHAQESCPYFPASVKRLHVPFDDPPLLAAEAATEEEAMAPYRRVRDEIKTFVENLDL
ncbi:arsenate reductase ArsC [Desulfosoma caldarium]|uniref:Protein tyrosine phosphatase n=1 Tax=Desulfosoma caldarium TaxID=610254 RepID=A0A3N1UMC1_9BACT|nr:arsenate reductase ArsC [Desulfosoma caldarium]ROQ92352.1 protein tyrosine phosphatase [Desulfosoma caldarium]